MDFSVLLSVYKGEKPGYLEECLDSLLAQTLPPREVVLVEDGPITGALEKVIAGFKKRLPLKSVILRENKGLSHALNAGLKECAHQWVARMDTDDVCTPQRLEKTADFIRKHPTVDIVGTFATRIDENGKILDQIRVPVQPKRIRKLIWTCPMIHPSVCFKRDKILRIGGYDTKAGPRQDDYELWFRCAFAGYEFRNIPEPLLLYRFTYSNMRRNDFRVGFHQLKNGFKGNRMMGFGPLAYVGVTIPFFRSLLPYPLNKWFYQLQNKINPRIRSATGQ